MNIEQLANTLFDAINPPFREREQNIKLIVMALKSVTFTKEELLVLSILCDLYRGENEEKAVHALGEKAKQLADNT